MPEADKILLSLLDQVHDGCNCEVGYVLPTDEEFCMDLHTVVNSWRDGGKYRSTKALGRMFGVSYQTIYNRARDGEAFKAAKLIKIQPAVAPVSTHITTKIDLSSGGNYIGSFSLPLTVQG